MGLKLKPGMYCERCQRPVAGQKTTAKAAKLTGTVLSGGTYVGAPAGYHCPTCGGPVAKLPKAQRDSTPLRLSDRGVMVVVVVVAVLLLAAVVAGVKAIAHAAASPHVVPDVQNQPLPDAKSVLSSAGVSYTYNKDQGVFGIVNEDNWYVCGEAPAPGTRTKKKVFLTVKHWGC